MFMSKIKTKKVVNNKNNQGYTEEDNQKQVKWLLIISIIIAIVFMSFYFLTQYIVEKRTSSHNTVNKYEFEDESILLSQMLKQKEEEYYVIAIKPNDPLTDQYNSGLVAYIQSEDSLPVYYVDMTKAMNKQVLGDETKITDDVRDIRLAETTLFHIKDGEISDSYSGANKVINQINILS